MREQVTRDQVTGAIEAGLHHDAYRAVQRLWSQEPGSATAGFVLTQAKRLREHIPLVSKRIAILRSFTVEPIVPILRAASLIHGVDATVHVGEFNSYSQEFLNPSDALYTFDPDIVILAVQTRDIAPELWGWENEAASSGAIERVIDQYRSLLNAFRARHRASIVVHDFEVPVFPRHGILDAQASKGQASAIANLNLKLRELAGQIPGVSVLGYDALVAAHGRLRWFDARKWLMARLPISADCLVHMGTEWSRFVACLAGRQAKVIVTDLDNTMWGGIAGEDGANGLKLGQEYPGALYAEYQEALLACYERGIMLAIASKNNSQDAMEVLENHPGMILRPQHFAAMRINWNDKAQSIREIAEELNIGVDSVTFLDDNPAERERIRKELPDVTVLEFSDPLHYASLVRSHAGFQRIKLVQEDKERNRYYIESKQREQVAASAASLEDYYHSLQQEVIIEPVNASTLERIAQLTQKTNQFNLTTKRYTEQEIERLAATDGWNVYGATVKDRFGDNGLVAVMVTSKQGNTLDIDTFLMSCRVIGRTVETSILAALAADARSKGCTAIRGHFIPTKKNAPAADYFGRHGFQRVTESESVSEWSLDLAATMPSCPEWIRLSGFEHSPKEESLSACAAV